MFITLGILVISSLIAYFSIPALVKKKDFKTIWTFTILLLIGTALNIANGLEIKIPSPLDLITKIFHPIRESIIAFFK